MKNCTRFFTQELIDEIRMRLAAIAGAKDSLFELALPVDGTEKVAIVQHGKNRLLDISDLKLDIGILDSEPTPSSLNAVTSAGIYYYIQNIINNIPSVGDSYLYIKSNSEMFDCLLNYDNGSSSGYQQSEYNLYCELIYNTIENGSFIIIDNAICVSQIVTDPTSFTISCISNTKYITIMAMRVNDNNWRLISGTISTTSRYLIDNRYLSTQLLNYLTINSFENKIDSTPTLGSSNLVSSDGIFKSLSTLRNYINNLSSLLASFIDEYNDRMELTPKYHKLNWLTDEKATGSEDSQGGYEITDDSSTATAWGRFSSLWWAIKDSTVGNKVSKVILYYGIPIVYANTDDLNNVDSATIIVIRLFDGSMMTSYKITKRTRDNENYLHILPLGYEVTEPDDTITPDTDPEPEPVEP